MARDQSWWQLLNIQAAGAVCLPVIMIGHLLYYKFGWSGALLGIGVGNFFLLVIGCFFAFLSAGRFWSTAEHAGIYFGGYGRVFFASLIMLSMLGWFGIQLNLMSLGLKQLFDMAGISSSLRWLNLGVGMIITIGMCLGIRGMRWLSVCTAPLLGLTLVWAVLAAEGSISREIPFTISWLGGISLAIGVNIVGVIDLPTFFRHARTKRDAIVCVLLLYGVIFPLIEMAGVYFSSISGGSKLILEVLQLGYGSLWGAGFIFLSGWGINNINLYSALTASYSLVKGGSTILRTIFLGAIGIVIGGFNPLEKIEYMFDLFGITIGAMGAVIFAGYCLEKKGLSLTSILSWMVGVLVALVSMRFHWFITGVPVFDAFICSFGMQFFLSLYLSRKMNVIKVSRNK